MAAGRQSHTLESQILEGRSLEVSTNDNRAQFRSQELHDSSGIQIRSVDNPRAIRNRIPVGKRSHLGKSRRNFCGNHMAIFELYNHTLREE